MTHPTDRAAGDPSRGLTLIHHHVKRTDPDPDAVAALKQQATQRPATQPEQATSDGTTVRDLLDRVQDRDPIPKHAVTDS